MIPFCFLKLLLTVFEHTDPGALRILVFVDMHIELIT